MPMVWDCHWHFVVIIWHRRNHEKNRHDSHRIYHHCDVPDHGLRFPTDAGSSCGANDTPGDCAVGNACASRACAGRIRMAGRIQHGRYAPSPPATAAPTATNTPAQEVKPQRRHQKRNRRRQSPGMNLTINNKSNFTRPMVQTVERSYRVWENRLCLQGKKK